MSLIEEALRRVQDPVTGTTVQPRPAARQPKQESSSTTGALPTTTSLPAGNRTTRHTAVAAPVSAPVLMMLTTLAILIVSAVLVISASLWLKRAAQIQRTQHELRASPPAPVVPRQPEASKASASSETARAKPKPAFVLTGIVEGRGEPYAIINGAIVRIGEQVQDATLRDITHGVVTLEHPDGTRTTLRAPR